MNAFTVRIDRDGAANFIYSDALDAMMREPFGGDVCIERASHVEPTADGRWTADMGPQSGPVLGAFDTRAEALAAEVRWLKANRNL